MARNAVLHFEMAHFVKIGRFVWKHLVHFFEIQTKEICRHLSEKVSKGRFPTLERLQNHSNESKELKRKGDKEIKDLGERAEEKKKIKQ